MGWLDSAIYLQCGVCSLSYITRHWEDLRLAISDTQIVAVDSNGESRVTVDGPHADIHMVGSNGKENINIDGDSGRIILQGQDAFVHTKSDVNQTQLVLGPTTGLIVTNSSGQRVCQISPQGKIELLDDAGNSTIRLDGQSGNIWITGEVNQI